MILMGLYIIIESGAVSHLLFQLLCEHSVLLWRHAVGGGQVGLAAASVGRHDGRRVHQRRRQHLPRTGQLVICLIINYLFYY